MFTLTNLVTVIITMNIVYLVRVISSSKLQVTVNGCPRINLKHFGYFLPFELEKC